MAIESTDLFVVQRAADKKLYNINLGSLISQVPNELPEGTADGDLLIWDNLTSKWEPGDHIDCGTY